LEKCNKWGFKAYDVYNNNKKPIFDLIEEYKQKDREHDEPHLLSVAESRYRDALITLEKETEDANKHNDTDLLYEISIIKDELENVNQTVKELIKTTLIQNDTYEELKWWPDVLFPLPTNLKPRKEQIEELKKMKFYYTNYYV
jgi:predicted RNase H-like nuclease (RuvC/YqgF family)